jgi:hypothetical protein
MNNDTCSLLVQARSSSSTRILLRAQYFEESQPQNKTLGTQSYDNFKFEFSKKKKRPR